MVGQIEAWEAVDGSLHRTESAATRHGLQGVVETALGKILGGCNESDRRAQKFLEDTDAAISLRRALCDYQEVLDKEAQAHADALEEMASDGMPEDEEPTLAEQIDKMRDMNERLTILLSDPHPGLATWVSAVGALVERMANTVGYMHE